MIRSVREYGSSWTDIVKGGSLARLYIRRRTEQGKTSSKDVVKRHCGGAREKKTNGASLVQLVYGCSEDMETGWAVPTRHLKKAFLQ